MQGCEASIELSFETNRVSLRFLEAKKCVFEDAWLKANLVENN